MFMIGLESAASADAFVMIFDALADVIDLKRFGFKPAKIRIKEKRRSACHSSGNMNR